MKDGLHHNLGVYRLNFQKPLMDLYAQFPLQLGLDFQSVGDELLPG